MFARQQAAALRDIKGELDGAGVALVAIGSGSPEGAAHFAKKLRFSGEMYVNQDLGAYKAFRLERGLLETLGPTSLIRGIQAMKKGFRQGRTDGDLWQQGGVFVLGPGNRLVFQHRNKSAGDHADLDAVLSAALG
ncbi:MAG: AhpC/TSA family protein [Desulfobacterota bacterium]|jgi:hypothetical protein|nr:AhpC/TSA family protein [Thermodesulfobacteriota bacterium]